MFIVRSISKLIAALLKLVWKGLIGILKLLFRVCVFGLMIPLFIITLILSVITNEAVKPIKPGYKHD